MQAVLDQIDGKNPLPYTTKYGQKNKFIDELTNETINHSSKKDENNKFDDASDEDENEISKKSDNINYEKYFQSAIINYNVTKKILEDIEPKFVFDCQGIKFLEIDHSQIELILEYGDSRSGLEPENKAHLLDSLGTNTGIVKIPENINILHLCTFKTPIFKLK
jgi:hypothetical protein